MQELGGLVQSEEKKFYKYYSSSTALLVLQSGKTRWSAPRLFNDPFDFPSQMHYSFSGREAAEAITEELLSLAYGSAALVGDTNNEYLKVAQLFRILPNKPSRADFKEMLASSIEDASRKFDDHKLEATKKLVEKRDACAVFCVTDVKDNLLMWSHYAESHTGCVFKFRDLVGSGQRLQFAQRVAYVDCYPFMIDVASYAKLITGQIKFDPDEVSGKFLLSKSKHWEYENESRATFPLTDIDKGFDYCDLLEDELQEVYIGCKADDEYANKVVQLVSELHPRTQVFKARNQIQDYSIQFERIL